uniref:peptidylprolyl isomerase n=1 Tax=Anthurium amnicola TaxID=1678845 RepID=A0A1D1YS89_9ARAE
MATVMVVELTLFPLGRREGQQPLPLHLPIPGSSRTLKVRGSSRASRPQPTVEPFLPCCCSSEPSAMTDSSSDFTPVLGSGGRRWLVGSSLSAAVGLSASDIAGAVSTSRRALKGAKIPESDYTTLPNGLKYYDLKVGSGAEAVKGSRVAVHYVAKWKGITFMTSRQGLGVGGGTPYGFDVGQSEKGNVLKGLDLGVQGMRVGGQRLLLVPPRLAYGSRGVQEIPPNATIELDVELLSIKQSPFGTGVKVIEG